MALEVVRNEPNPNLGYGNRINWGAIFCGSFVTVASGVFFMLLGNAVGLSALNVVAAGVGTALRDWSWIYALATLIISFYIGGFTTASLANIRSSGASALHGFSTWAVSGVFMVVASLFFSPYFRTILGGTGPNDANWLILCVAGGGCLLSILGGLSGHTRAMRVGIREGREEQRAA